MKSTKLESTEKKKDIPSSVGGKSNDNESNQGNQNQPKFSNKSSVEQVWSKSTIKEVGDGKRDRPGRRYPTTLAVPSNNASNINKPSHSLGSSYVASIRSSIRNPRFDRLKEREEQIKKIREKNKKEKEEEERRKKEEKHEKVEEPKIERKSRKDSKRSQSKTNKKNKKKGKKNKKKKNEKKKPVKKIKTKASKEYHDRLPQALDTDRYGQIQGGETARGLINRDQRIEDQIGGKKAAKEEKARPTFEELTENLEQRSYLRNWLIMVSVVLTASFFGYYISISTVIVKPLMIDVYGYSEEEVTKYSGQFGSMFALGMVVSNFMIDVFTRNVGRIRTLVLCEFLKIIIILCFEIKSIQVFLVLRFFIGFVAGINTSLPPIICYELFPRKLGTIGQAMGYSVVTIFMVAASSMAYIFGGQQGLAENWQLILSWPLIITLFVLASILSTMGLNETPDFYIENFKDNELKLREVLQKSMMKIYTNDSAIRYTNIKMDELREIRKNQEITDGKETEISMGWSNMLDRRFRKQFLVCLGLNLCQQLSGIGFLTYFSTQVFDKLNGNGATLTMVFTVGNFFGSLLALNVDQFGRRTGQLVGSFLHAVAIVGMYLGVVFSNSLVLGASIVLYITTFACALGSIFTIYNVEVLPPFGLGFCFAVQWLFSALIGLVGPKFIDAYGLSNMILILLGGCVCYFLYVLFFCHEIKGYSREEIGVLFRNGGKFVKEEHKK